MDKQLVSIKKQARFTGLLYFLFAVMALYVYMYVSPLVITPGDINATAKNMMANEFLFRTGLVTSTITFVLFLIVVFMLYRLLKDVHVHQARIMTGFVIIGIAISLTTGSLYLVALSVFKEETLSSFASQQSLEIAALLLKLANNTGQLVSFFWGAWLIPLGLLVYKSGFIPRLFGVLLIINGAAYIINNFIFVLWPENQEMISKFIYPAYFAGEVPFIFWLMIKGVKNRAV